MIEKEDRTRVQFRGVNGENMCMSGSMADEYFAKHKEHYEVLNREQSESSRQFDEDLKHDFEIVNQLRELKKKRNRSSEDEAIIIELKSQLRTWHYPRIVKEENL